MRTQNRFLSLRRYCGTQTTRYDTSMHIWHSKDLFSTFCEAKVQFTEQTTTYIEATRLNFSPDFGCFMTPDFVHDSLRADSLHEIFRHMSMYLETLQSCDQTFWRQGSLESWVTDAQTRSKYTRIHEPCELVYCTVPFSLLLKTETDSFCSYYAAQLILKRRG